MENFQTEEQQVEAIKSFWSKNGNSVIAGLVIGFSGFIGFNYYQDDKLSTETTISESYITLQENSADNSESFTKEAADFIAANGDSSFASLTALALAKEATTHKDWAGAEKHLNTAIDKSVNEGIKAISLIRLARVQIQTEQFEKALTTLDTPLPAAFLASVESAKGDTYLLQGKKELARTAYQTAIDNKGLEMNPNLQMKLDDLAEVTVLTK